MTHGVYHLKKLLWFNGWMPKHCVLVETEDGLKARCIGATDGPDHFDKAVPDEMLTKIEEAAPGSLPAIMGFELLFCEGEPGSGVLNRPLAFATPVPESIPAAG